MKYSQKPSIILTKREREILENLAHSLTRRIVYLWYDRWLMAQDRLRRAQEAFDTAVRPPEDLGFPFTT